MGASASTDASYGSLLTRFMRQPRVVNVEDSRDLWDELSCQVCFNGGAHFFHHSERTITLEHDVATATTVTRDVDKVI